MRRLPPKGRRKSYLRRPCAPAASSWRCIPASLTSPAGGRQGGCWAVSTSLYPTVDLVRAAVRGPANA